MSPDRQALLSFYHDDATALLDRALHAQHEPDGLHLVHAALVEALANAHIDGREPGVSTTVPDETIEAAQRALDNCGEESRMVHRDHLANALAEVRRLTTDRALTHEQAVQACANVGVDLTCGACAAVFYTGVGSPHDVHTCAGRDESDALRRSAEAAIRETGALRDGVTEAIGLAWRPIPQPFGATAYACPDDRDIINFFDALAGGPCPHVVFCDIDFNNNGVYPEDQDVIDYFSVLAGGSCE